MSFLRGDLVQLKTGGPRMIVEEVEDGAGSAIRCKWYEDRQRRVDVFYVDGLQHCSLVANGGD